MNDLFNLKCFNCGGTFVFKKVFDEYQCQNCESKFVIKSNHLGIQLLKIADAAVFILPQELA